LDSRRGGDVAEDMGDPVGRHSRHRDDAAGHRPAPRAGGAISAAGRRRVRDHRVGERQAAGRIPAYRRVRRVRDPEVALAWAHRPDLRRRVGVLAAVGAERAGGKKGGALLSLFRPRRAPDWIALALLLGLIAATAASAVWLSRYAVAVHRLTRGIG